MYYLSADGGGTKLSTLLFDDQLRLIASGRAAGTNATFRPPEDVRADMARAIEACLGANPPEIEHARCTIVGPTDEFIACLRRKTTVRAVSSPSEGALALAEPASHMAFWRFVEPDPTFFWFSRTFMTPSVAGERFWAMKAAAMTSAFLRCVLPSTPKTDAANRRCCCR